MSDLEKKPQCLSCKHNLSNSSCGSCADIGSTMIKELSETLGVEIENEAEKEINSLKYNCKILVRYPEDFNQIDVYNCKFYLPSAFCFR